MRTAGFTQTQPAPTNFANSDLAQVFATLYGKLPTQFLLQKLYGLSEQEAGKVWEQLLEEELESATVEQIAKGLRGEDEKEEGDGEKAATPAD